MQTRPSSYESWIRQRGRRMPTLLSANSRSTFRHIWANRQTSCAIFAIRIRVGVKRNRDFTRLRSLQTIPIAIHVADE